MKNSETCEHDNFEILAEGVEWCPDCAARWAISHEQIERIYALFMQKLAERNPNHPWVSTTNPERK